MNINQSQLIELIHQGEGLMMEFKKCRNQLNKDVYETVCAFLNRHGGTLLLGINDDGEILGIDPDSIVQIKKDFVTAINNAQKINPPAYLSVEEVEIDQRIILRVYVPESSQVHRCNGRIYDRNEDGDFDITNHTRQVADLYHRKTASYSENKIYPHAGLVDLRIDLIARCRKIATLRQEDHPWGDMDDLELLKSAQLYQTDPELIEGDIFKIIIKYPDYTHVSIQSDKAHQEAHDKAHQEAHDELTEVERKILQACLECPKNTQDILQVLGYKTRTGNFKTALIHLLEAKFLERTLPETPRSKKQQYRLTPKGLLLQNNSND